MQKSGSGSLTPAQVVKASKIAKEKGEIIREKYLLEI
jgi:exosome complex component RRP42